MISKQHKSPRFLVIGAGSRGSAYARAVNVATNGSIVAVAEPDLFKRREFGKKFISTSDEETDVPTKEFSGWQEWLDWELELRANGRGSSVDGVFICTLDPTHVGIIQALAPLGLHILCEKPLALSLKDCLSIQSCLQPREGLHGTQTAEKVFSIGHVLRYSPHNTILRKLLLQERVIGSVVSLEHTEPIGWWHFSHSYVRGNWRKATPEGVGSLLTKSCHDIDFIMWLLCSPALDHVSGEHPHLPSTISSSGHLTHFKKARKPSKAGNATNCLSCAAEPECNFSAKKIYRDRWLQKERDAGWPLKIVVPEIEDLVSTSGWDAGENALMRKLGEDYDDSTVDRQKLAEENYFGRCVYECDNDVVDTQQVTITWDEEAGNTDPHRGPKTAIFNMTYPTQSQCERRGRIYGTSGEMTYDSKSISVYSFADDKVVTHAIPQQSAEEMKSHGGGDYGLARGFVEAVDAVENAGMAVDEAQRKFVGCTLEECIRSHAVVFAAEEARINRQVVHWQRWWDEKKSTFPID
ncbi:MAG: hypothetical protein Q9160_005943 [Pyrenula sp. 1 TL-2023]